MTTRGRKVLSGTVALLAAAALSGICADAPVAITNYKNGETIRHPVALLRGTLATRDASEILILNRTSRRDTREIKGVACQGNFKGMAELVPGTNEVLVKAGDREAAITLVYMPQTNPYRVQAFYFVPPDGNTRFETPFKNDAGDFRGKYDTMLKCCQSFVADWMNECGYGRKTFNLEFDENGKVVVHVVKAARPVEEYTPLGRYPIAQTVGDEVVKAVGQPDCNYFGCVAFSRHLRKGENGAGHATCYGMVNIGNISLFGGAIFYTWPDSLAGVVPRLTQDDAIDGDNFHADDSRGGRVWATAANTWGAALHELTHAYYVPHSADRSCVMSTGYDQLNRYFTFTEPPTAKRKEAERFTDSGRTKLSPVTAAALAPTRFMALDQREWGRDNTVSVDIDAPKGEFLFRSDAGIRFVAPEKWYGDGPHASWFIETPYDKPAPRELRVSAEDIRKHCKAVKGISVRIVDADGQYRICNDLGSVAMPACVRNWQFAPEALRWESTNSLPDLPEAKRKSLEAATRTAPLEKGWGNQVDLGTFTRGMGSANTAVYALRIIRTEQPRAVRVLGGGNDTLRVWLNGKVVMAERGGGADAHAADMHLSAGENVMLVEVWNRGGWFNLILRLTDEAGKPLRLADDGTLAPAVDFEPYRPLFGDSAPPLKSEA